MTNESENITNEKIKAEIKQIEVNTILNVADVIGDEEVLKQICDQLDLDYDALKDQVEKIKEEQNLAAAKKKLEGVAVDGEAIEEINPEGTE